MLTVPGKGKFYLQHDDEICGAPVMLMVPGKVVFLLAAQRNISEPVWYSLW